MSSTDDPSRIVKDLLAKARPIRTRPSIAWLILAVLLAIGTHSIYRDWAQPISGEQLLIISKLVADSSNSLEVPPDMVWRRVYDRFEIKSPLELREKEFSHTVKFIVSINGSAE